MALERNCEHATKVDPLTHRSGRVEQLAVRGIDTDPPVRFPGDDASCRCTCIPVRGRYCGKASDAVDKAFDVPERDKLVIFPGAAVHCDVLARTTSTSCDADNKKPTLGNQLFNLSVVLLFVVTVQDHAT